MGRRVGLLVVLALLLGGCGGGNSNEDFSAEVDEACAPVAPKFKGVNAELKRANTAQDPDAFAAGLSKLQSLIAKLQGRLETIDPPDIYREEYDVAVKELGEVADMAGQEAQAISSGDFAAQQSIELERRKILKKIDRHFVNLGLGCSPP